MTVFEIQSNSRKRDVKFVSLIRLVAPPTIFANNFHLQTYVPSTQELGKKEKREALSLWSTIHLHLKVFLYSADAAKMEPKSGRDKLTQRLTNVAVVQNGRIDIGTSL